MIYMYENSVYEVGMYQKGVTALSWRAWVACRSETGHMYAHPEPVGPVVRSPRRGRRLKAAFLGLDRLTDIQYGILAVPLGVKTWLRMTLPTTERSAWKVARCG